MPLNKLQMLKGITGLLVFPDIAPDGFDEYITYTEEDEKNALYADDTVQEETHYIQVNLYTKPDNKKYREIRKKTKSYLKSIGFSVTSVQSLIDTTKSNKLVKHTIFTAEITVGTSEEE